MIILPIYRMRKKYTALCCDLSNMKIILYKHIEYSRVATSPADAPCSQIIRIPHLPCSSSADIFFLNGATGNGIIINRNLLFGHQIKNWKGCERIGRYWLFSLSSNRPILCNQRSDKMKWNSVWAICRMFDSNNRVRRALKPPYVGHIKFISIILLVWSAMIAFITFIGSHRVNFNLRPPISAIAWWLTKWTK